MSRPRDQVHVASVIVIAEFGRDAETLADVIEQRGAHAHVCQLSHDLSIKFTEATTAIMVTEESLGSAADPILDGLDKQPAWSDLPVIVLSSNRGKTSSSARWDYFREFGNVAVLERPLSKQAISIALEAAGRNRAWQYVVRDQMLALESQNDDLEKKVRERTQALSAETEERKRYESALNEARRLEAIGRLTAGVAHDFNNLLQVISGACELLPYARQSSVRTDTLLNTISRATERGSKLAQQMLAFGRRQALSTSYVDIAQHVMGMKELLQQVLSGRGVLELRLQADLWQVQTDITQLEVALLNLVVNAKDALTAGGTVTLSARNTCLPAAQIPEVTDLTGDFVWLNVADNGPGMPPGVAAQAFEPFFTTKPVGEGSGLGLSQVYGFAKQSEGSAWIRTSTRGTSVSILLPRTASTQRALLENADSITGQLDKLQNLHVLYVEDDEDVGNVGVSLLNMLGCQVDWVTNAEAALGRNLSSYGLVFSDVQMPGSMDGIALAKEIQRKGHDLPVVLASGYIVGPDRLQEVRAEVISKPYDVKKLREVLLKQFK